VEHDKTSTVEIQCDDTAAIRGHTIGFLLCYRMFVTVYVTVMEAFTQKGRTICTFTQSELFPLH